MISLPFDRELNPDVLNIIASKLLGNTPVSMYHELRSGSTHKSTIQDHYSDRIVSKVHELFKEKGICFNKSEYGWSASALMSQDGITADYVECNYYGNDLYRKGLHLLALLEIGPKLEIN